MKTTKRWVHAYSGEEVDFEFDYTEPEKFNWPIVSVAHHLAYICRYTGATRRHYSVAEHSARVSLYAADLVQKYGDKAQAKDAARKGLMHDATEMVVGDVNSPLKGMPWMQDFKIYEERLHKLVALKHSLTNVYIRVDGLDWDVVRVADLQALEFERVQLLGKPPREWLHLELPPVIESKAFEGELGMEAEAAEHGFNELAAILGLT